MVETGKEIIDKSELSKVKSVYEMMPSNMVENQRSRWNAAKINEDHFKTIEDCLRLDFTIREACDAAGISVSSYYAYYNNDQDFALRMDRAKNFPKQMARTAVMKRIWQWDAKTALRYLELRDKNRYNTVPWLNEEWENEWHELPKVQFISVSSNEWADQSKSDSQTSINVNSVSDTSVNFSESWTENQTWWENEEEVLRRLDSSNFSNG